MQEIKVIKRSTENYALIYDVHLPISFFFNEDDGFDGIEVYVENALERDQKLVKELCLKLARATGISYSYDVVSKEDDGENEEI